jgi:ADP-ribosylglycohydrolase
VDFVALLKGVRGLSKAEADVLVLGGKEPMARADVRSGGYVIDTYNAAIWCFATTQSYRDCVVEAVNLGEDTDTTACVAGALAAAFYGMDAIPADWMDALQGKDVIEAALKGSE